MGDMCKITYIHHSGFLVETEHRYLLFDYWTGDIPLLDAGKPLYIFSSHAHHDHYTKEIFELENRCDFVQYILSSDIRKKSSFWKKAERVCFLAPDETSNIDGMEVTTFCSTDEGVAFLVKVDGKVIYHAGDLHWWYWPGDSDEENEGSRKDNYLKEIKKLSGENIDVSFVVLDPRQEYAGGYGMDLFLENVHSRYIFPMHFWEDYNLIREYKQNNEKKYPVENIMEITKQGQYFEINE